MSAKGYGKASGAGTVINAIATYKGSAFGIDRWTYAEVELGEDFKGIEAHTELELELELELESELELKGERDKNKGRGRDVDIDTRLIERCLELVLKKFNLPLCGYVYTRSDGCRRCNRLW